MNNQPVAVHLMADQVFNDMAIRELERVSPEQHTYLVLSKDLRRTKSPLAIRANEAQIRKALTAPHTKVVVFHSLPPAWYRFIRQIPPHVRIVWIGMGFDYYPLIHSPLVLPKTQRLMPTSWLKQLRSQLITAYLNFGIGPYQSLQSQLQRVDLFAPVLDSEFALVVNHFPLRAGYIDWNYGSVEEDFNPPFHVDQDHPRVHVLAGNSAYETNNHIELIDALRDHPKLATAKVYMPLSYGRAPYRDSVIAYGREVLGSALHPITEFMPLSSYNNLIAECGFVVMNHLRQQGLGNVLTALLAGSKVYLNPLNPLYDWLTAKGMHIGSTEDIDLVALSHEEQHHNQRLVKAHWSQSAQQERVAAFVQQLFV